MVNAPANGARPASEAIAGVLRQWRTTKSNPENSAVDVPVLVDSVKKLNKPLTRCVYFAVDSVDVAMGWQLLLDNEDMPSIIVTAMAGLICGPDAQTKLFNSATHIEEVFESIETKGELMVVSGELMLPTSLLRSGKTPPLRGQVFRVGIQLMRVAFLFRDERIDHALFERECKKLQDFIRPSPGETEAFQVWSNNQILSSRDNFKRQQDENRSLSWQGEES
jgi:hypothetical protein